MKRTRKLASLLLALVMVLALATTAFATEPVTPTTTGTITVDNPVAGRTYTAYKIFDVVYDAAKEHYSYTIDSRSAWFSTVQNYTNGLTLTQVGDTTAYVVTTTDAFSAPAFAAALKAALDAGTTTFTGTELTKSGTPEKASATVDELGYYFVSSNTGALCNLTTTNSDVTIHDKNDMPFEKTDNKVSADVGETVNYTITGKVPDTTGFETYTYEIADTMSDGLTFKKDVKVTVGSADVTADCNVAYNANGNANSFTVTIPVMSYQIGAAIEVTYTATVNEKAIAVVSNNEAKLTYSNNPTDSESKTTTPAQKQEVYSSKIVIDKYETGKKTTKLPNAKFVLYKEETPGTPASAVYYKWNDTDKKVEWVTEMTAATVMTTNDQGEATFGGLADGTYHLVETEAPAGYNPLTAPVPVTVAGSSTDTTKLSVTAEVENKTGTTLPTTGGMGTTIFYVLGAVLVLGAVVLLVTKKRMSDANR